MRRAGIVAVIIAVIIVGLFGCKGYVEYVAVSNLKVELVNVAIGRLGLTSADLLLTYEFYNPTGFDSPTFSSKDLRIYIDGTLVGIAMLPPTSVPANSAKRETITITLEYAKIGEALVKMLIARKGTITIEGVIDAKIIFGLIPVSIPFKTSVILL